MIYGSMIAPTYVTCICQALRDQKIDSLHKVYASNYPAFYTIIIIIIIIHHQDLSLS